MRVVIWAAMVFSVAMYYVVVRMMTPADAASNPMLVQILLLVAVALVAASFGVKGHFFKRARDLKNQAFIRAGELIALLLCESAALIGVVVWFLTASPQYYWFLIAGAAGQLFHFPRKEE